MAERSRPTAVRGKERPSDSGSLRASLRSRRLSVERPRERFRGFRYITVIRRSEMKLSGLLPLCAAALLLPVAAGAQVAVQSEAVEVTVGGRVQTQFNTTTIYDEAPSELILRRARLELEVRLNDLVVGVLDPEFAGDEVTLKDAYVKLEFSPA